MEGYIEKGQGITNMCEVHIAGQRQPFSPDIATT